MFARLFDPGTQANQVGLGKRPHRNHIGQRRFALGQRACLVDHDGVDLLQRLQGGGVPDEDPLFRPPANADHDRHRRRQPQGTGTGDDQHSDRIHKRPGQRRLSGSGNGPHEKGHDRDQHDGRHEVTGHGIGHLLDRRPAALGLRHHRDDPGQHRLLAHLAGPHEERAGLIHRATDDRVARDANHRHRFAGEHRLVDAGTSLGDVAIHRHFFAGPHPQDVAGTDFRQRDFLLGALADNPGGRRGQRQQLPDGGAGSLAGPQFQHLPQQHQGDDHGGRLEIDLDGAMMLKLLGNQSGEQDGDEAV